jgi:hypothetical protein
VPKKQNDQLYSDEEIAHRRDAVIRYMLNTPPKPHSAMKIGNRKAKASSKKRERTAKTKSLGSDLQNN